MTREERIAATLAEVGNINSLHQQEIIEKTPLQETLSSLYEIGISDIPPLLKHLEETDNQTFYKVLNALVVCKLANVPGFDGMQDSEILSALQAEQVEGRIIQAVLSTIRRKRAANGD